MINEIIESIETEHQYPNTLLYRNIVIFNHHDIK